MDNKVNVLIPDGESIWAINVIQCIGNDPTLNLHVLSENSSTASKYSKYITSFENYVFDNASKTKIAFINSVIRKKGIDIVLPIAENMSKLLIANKNQIHSTAKLVGLPSIKNYEIAVNKLLLYNFLIAHNLPTPNSWILSSKDNIKEKLKSISFPVLIKPLKGKGGEGIIRKEDYASLYQYIKTNIKKGDLFVQHYLSGFDIDCSVFCENGKIIAYTIQKEFIKNKDPYAPQLGLEFQDNQEVFEIVSQLMADLNWNGIAHVDLRFDETEENYKILEINGRFWGSLIASKIVGVNFPLMVINKTLGIPYEYATFEHKNVVIFKGFLRLIAQNPLSIFNIKLYSYKSNVRSVLADPKPFLFLFWKFLKRLF